MTIWSPDIRKREGPVYRAIADAIAQALEAGELQPGEGLPTHRALARALGVTVGTVSRGYAEAERRGMVVGEVGRGTFVRGSEAGGLAALEESQEGVAVDMGLNFPCVTAEEGQILAGTLRTLASQPDHAHLLSYQRYSGSLRQRDAGARLLRRLGLDAEAAGVLVTAGAQHALNVIFATLTRPGDLVFTESLTYPGMKSLAQMLGLGLHGLPMDEHGLIPEAFEEACQADEARALYVIPTLQNPTCSIMPAERRRRIAEIGERHGVLIVEDDVHGLLVEKPPSPITTYAPENSIYVASTGKSIAASLRVGYLLAPERLLERLDAGVRTTTWMASPITAEIASLWINEGTVDRIVAGKRALARERQRIVREQFAGFDYVAHPEAIHVWLPLPEPWRSGDFVEQARQRGVQVTGAEVFAVGREAIPHAVRLGIAAPASHDALSRGLGVLREILEGRSEPCRTVV
jgi:DNA-binding transcriptional MocR family regulator